MTLKKDLRTTSSRLLELAISFSIMHWKLNKSVLKNHYHCSFLLPKKYGHYYGCDRLCMYSYYLNLDPSIGHT